MPTHRKSGSKRSRRPKPPSVPRPIAPGGGASSGASGDDPDAAAGRFLPASRSLADWPVHEAMVNAGWERENQLATVYIARRHPQHDRIAFGGFVVDLQCLGIKNAMYKRNRDVLDYERRTRAIVLSPNPDLIPVAPALAAKIVAEGLAYAKSLGFDPHPDFQIARQVLDGLDPDDDPTRVPVGGKNGKPYFIAGPYDDTMAIIHQLAERLGPDGFHSTVVIDPKSAHFHMEDVAFDEDFDDDTGDDREDDSEDDSRGMGSIVRRLLGR